MNLKLDRKNELFFSLVICLFISYIIILRIKSYIFYHTDSLVPIEQIKLLKDYSEVNITDLHLARIPSLLPDLAILYFVITFLGDADYFTIISSYSFISELLLLLGLNLILLSIYRSKYSWNCVQMKFNECFNIH